MHTYKLGFGLGGSFVGESKCESRIVRCLQYETIQLGWFFFVLLSLDMDKLRTEYRKGRDEN